MGWRFRKSVRLASFLRLNFSGSGVSVGLGPRGANVNISKRGIRQTIGLPGSGISHQTFTSWKSAEGSELKATPIDVRYDGSSSASSGRGAVWAWLVFAALVALMLMAALGPKPEKAPSKPENAFPVVPSSPAQAPPVRRSLTVEEVREVQTLLRDLGFDPGGADGIVGPNTIAAVKRYEPSRGWPASGEIDLRLLDSLRASKAARSQKPALPTSSSPTGSR